MKENRRFKRTYLGHGNSILAEMTSQETSTFAPVRDFSKLGIRAIAMNFTPVIGQVFENLTVRFGSEIVGNYRQSVIKWFNQETMEFGVEFVEAKNSDVYVRKQDRYDLDPDLRPLLSAEDPIFGGEVLHFVVEDISPSGLKLSTSLSNRHILVGSRMRKATLFLPCVGAIPYDLEVLWIKTEDGKLKMGVQHLHPTKSLIHDILQFILFSSYRRIQTLPELEQFIKISPFQIKAFKKALRIRIIETEKDREQMLNLRWVSYLQAGKLKGDLKAKDMWDEYDPYSVSYGVYLGRIMIGTFRSTRSNGEHEPFPFEKLLPASEVKNFKRIGRIEISKMGILPSLQNSDVLLAMFEAVSRQIVYSSTNMYIFTTNALEKNYRRLGAFKVSKSIPHPTLPNENLKLYMVDWYLSMIGKNTSGLTWHKVIKPVYYFYRERGLTKASYSRFRIFFLTKLEKMVLRFSKGR